MNKNFVEEVFEKLKDLYDLSKDCAFIERNVIALRSGNIEQMKIQLKESVERIRPTLEQWSWLTGDRMILVDNSNKQAVFFALMNTNNMIPLYVIFEHAKDEIFKRIFKF